MSRAGSQGRNWAVSTARVLFALGAAWWLVVGALLWTGAASVGRVEGGVFVAVVAAVLVDGIAMAAFAWLTFRGSRSVDYLAAAFVVANLVLTFTDEVGLADVAYLAFTVVLLVVLVLGIRATRGLEASG